VAECNRGNPRIGLRRAFSERRAGLVAHDVFISYAIQDKLIADAVCARLEQTGVRCWIAPRDVGVGNFPRALAKAIAESRLLVVIVSAHANASPNVAREVHQALKRNVIIVPFRIEDVELEGDLEFLIGITHWLDALTPPREQQIQVLVSRVRDMLAVPAAAGASRPAANVKREQSVFEVTLVLPEIYGAFEDPIYVAGEFNNWLNAKSGVLRADPATLAHYKLTAAGGKRRPRARSIDLTLPAGEYEFKFVTAKFDWLGWVAASEHGKGGDAAGGANFKISVG
jgi:hypothetical protein